MGRKEANSPLLPLFRGCPMPCTEHVLRPFCLCWLIACACTSSMHSILPTPLSCPKPCTHRLAPNPALTVSLGRFCLCWLTACTSSMRLRDNTSSLTMLLTLNSSRLSTS